MSHGIIIFFHMIFSKVFFFSHDDLHMFIFFFHIFFHMIISMIIFPYVPWWFHMGMGQNLVPLVNIKIAGKWMFIPLKMVLIGIDPYPYDDFTWRFPRRRVQVAWLILHTRGIVELQVIPDTGLIGTVAGLMIYWGYHRYNVRPPFDS